MRQAKILGIDRHYATTEPSSISLKVTADCIDLTLACPAAGRETFVRFDLEQAYALGNAISRMIMTIEDDNARDERARNEG